MMLQSLTISNFKRINATAVPLTPITVLVGGNNSGKSCVLQAAHMAVGLLQSELEVQLDTFTPDKARYQPTHAFWDAAHGERLEQGDPPIAVTFRFKPDEAEAFDFSVEASRGAGEAIVLSVSEREATARLLSDVQKPFSIYVPGLAGIPLREEYCVDAALIRGIARGDANRFLRNVLLRISNDNDKLNRFNDLLSALIPDAALDVQFNPSLHQTIDARVLIAGAARSLEALGTGALQFIQILAYVVNFEPALLLLDEPDAHLHPNNQRMIAIALRKIAAEGHTRIVLATHSRTILDSFERVEDASFVWIENGEVQSEHQKDRISMLMTLGALDGAERFYSTECAGVVLTEDTETEYLKALLEANGATPGQVLVHSYRTSSQINAATLLASFINEVKPGVRVIIHRDRDFMTDSEVDRLKAKFRHDGGRYDLFITRLSDVEHYFVQPEHIANSTGLSVEDSKQIVDDCLSSNNILLYDTFRSKRDQIKWDLYSGDRDACPSAIDMVDSGKIGFDHALGKTLIKKVANALQEQHGKRKSDLLNPSKCLEDDRLSTLVAAMPETVVSSGDWPSILPKERVSA